MNVSLSNMLATSAWMAFLSVLAIVGIIVAGGFIVALLGRMVLSIVSPKGQDVSNPVQVDEFGYTTNEQGTYMTQSQEMAQQKVVEPQPQVETMPQDDYAYAVDVDDNLAMAEKEALDKESKSINDDDFFKDFTGDTDARFGDDDDLMSMIDEISQDILDEEETSSIQAQQAESQANESVLNKYSIDDYFDKEEEVNELDEYEVEQTEDIANVVDEQTMDEINTLKQQVKEIVDNMEENRNQNETFNEQLINILNELKEANRKDVRTVEDAEQEINSLKQQLEESRIEMEEQIQARVADKDAEMQKTLQEQLEKSNAEIEDLKAQLSALISNMEEPEEEPLEKEPEQEDEITTLRREVKEMIDAMRVDSDNRNNEINAQLVEILNEMKQKTLEQEENLAIESNQDAIEQVEDWQEDLELAEKELQEKFKEEMLHKSEEEKAELRAQMETYSAEIGDLKEQLQMLMDKFNSEKESAQQENQALLDQLEAERQYRIKVEQEKIAIEQEQLEQLEMLRKENEELADRIQNASIEVETLTQDEIDDLYSEVSNIDYSAISKMNEDTIEQKVKEELKDSKDEIHSLKEQIEHLTNYLKEREDSLAEQMRVHEVRMADFDIDQIKEVTAKEIEDKVNEKIVEHLAEIEILKDELIKTKQDVENQYKQQLADINEGMEYEFVNKLQDSAEKIDDLNDKLNKLTDELHEERKNAKTTSEECVAELESTREFEIAETVVGPTNNKVALISAGDVNDVQKIDIEAVQALNDAEIEEIVNARLKSSNDEIEELKNEIERLKKDIADKDEQISRPQETTVPVVRSPLFDMEMIKTITAQEVEKKVEERLAEAMKEIDAMKAQLELSKQEIERKYKEEIKNQSNNDVKERLKDSAAEVIELKEQLIDLTEQISLEHKEAKENSVAIIEQLDQEREIAKQQLAIAETSSVIEDADVTVIGPKNNQVALVSANAVLSESVEEITTIDIETVKRLTEQEIEEKVEVRMANSTIEIEELKKQILNLSMQINEMKGQPEEDDDSKPMVFHYGSEEAYLERIAILETRLNNAKKDLKINNKELNPLKKVKRTLERDKLKLRRKEAIVAKKKIDLYGVNNYVDLDKDKAEKLKQELELFEGLKLSVRHCEEVMSVNVDRYPILVHTDKILRENIENIESDIKGLNKELMALREKNGTNND